MNLLSDYADIGYIHYRSVLNFGQRISAASLSIFSACQWISTLNRWLERNAHKQRANVNGVGRDWNVGSLILVDLPMWRNEDRQSESYRNVSRVAVNHRCTFHVEKFYCNMFRLMYKTPSSGWQGTKGKLSGKTLSRGTIGKLSCRTPHLKVLKGSYQVKLCHEVL